MLRAACGYASGFARLEALHSRAVLVIHVQQISAQADKLRALLLSGDESTGAVMDLGLFPLNDRRQGQLTTGSLNLKLLGTPGGYHTLALCTDWPQPTLHLFAPLGERPRCTLWQMQQMIRRHLAVPARDSTPAPVEAAPPPQESVLSLREVHWPDEWADLKCYFDALPPAAPFDDPAWRYVCVPLQDARPAPRCLVGIQVQGNQVCRAAYALPGLPASSPPRGLEGYTWRQGRNNQGYWVLEQSIET